MITDDKEFLEARYGELSVPAQKSEAAFIGAMRSRQKADVPLRTVSINNDEEVEKKIKSTMLAGEVLGAWYNRVGLGRCQVLSLSIEKIREHIAVTANNERLPEPRNNDQMPQPRPVNSRFVMVG